LRHDARNDDLLDRVGRNVGAPKERSKEHAEFVARAAQRRRHAPRLLQVERVAVAQEEAELRLGVANVDCE